MTQYAGANICEQCSKCIVNTANKGLHWIRTVPYPAHIKDWSEWRCKNPDDIVEFAKEMLTKIVPELNEIEKETLAAIDLNNSFSSICFWDVQHVATIAECFVHWDHPKEEGVLFYPCSFSISQMQEFVRSGEKLKVPQSYKSLYVTIFHKEHNVLLCIERNFKQVVLYDGWQLRYPPEEVNKSTALKDALERMVEPVKLLLCMLGEMNMEEDLKVHLKNPRKKEIKDPKNSKFKWYLLSVTNRNNGSNEETILVAQKDDHSCGPLSIVHLIKALNQGTADFGNQELAINSSKSFLRGFEDKWISWMKECCGPDGLNEEPFSKLFAGSSNVRETKTNRVDDDGHLKPRARRQENAETGTLEQMASNTLQTESKDGTAILEESVNTTKTVTAAALESSALREAASSNARSDSEKRCPDGASAKTVTGAELNSLSEGANNGNVNSLRNEDDAHPVLTSGRHDDNKVLPAETNDGSDSVEVEQNCNGGDGVNKHHNDSNHLIGLFPLSQTIGSWYLEVPKYKDLVLYFKE